MVERNTSTDRDTPLPTDVDSIDSVMRAVAHVPSLGATALSALQVASSEESSASQGLPCVGAVLGDRYVLTDVLGRGGMGAVYAARNLGTGRDVAIKVLLPETRSEAVRRERVARFVREARAAGRIQHPNVVDVYDVDGRPELPYLVMERLYGESLGDRLRRGPLPLAEALRVLLDAMRGVAEAHRQGVIHRDLKPDNIFLATSSIAVEPVAKVLDFGVSRILMPDHGEAKCTTLTGTGHLLGTFEYMPLEQLRGAATVDARADVYALGVILYEAIAGVRPYEDVANERDLSVRLATEDAVPLSARLPGISPVLASVVARALEREPDKRFASVESFASELRAVCADAQLVVEQARVETPSSSKTRTARWGKLGLAIALVMVGALTAWLAFSRVPAFEPTQRAEHWQAPPPLPAVRSAVSTAPAPRPAPALIESQATANAREVATEQAPGGARHMHKREAKDSKVRVRPSKVRPAQSDRPTQLLKSDF